MSRLCWPQATSIDVHCSPDSKISSTTMVSSELSPELPLEILCEIIKFLPLTDLQTISLASQLIRSQAIHFIFGHLRYTRDIPLQIRKIHQARNDVKAVIKFACLFYMIKCQYLLDIILAQKTRTVFPPRIY